jgi:DNA-directed RNA polymerase specialized sigma24 family protein
MGEHSVTSWIAQLKDGDDAAAQAIWERFFGRLRDYARGKLGPSARRAQDEEDLALSAMHALCLGAREGRFRQLESRDDLWQILMMLAARKASNTRRRASVRREQGESDLAAANEPLAVDRLLDGPPSPAAFDALELHCEELLGLLDDKLRQVALLKLGGHTNEEIAALRGRGLSTIERYLQMIRQIWSEHAASVATAAPER